MKTFICTLLIISALSQSKPSNGGIIGTLVDSLGLKEEVKITAVTQENAFAAGLDKCDFDKIVGAQTARFILGAGPEITVIEAISSSDAEKLKNKISDEYEFAACDRAYQVIIASAKNMVLVVKGSTNDTQSVLKAFGNILGRGKVKILINSAKYGDCS